MAQKNFEVDGGLLVKEGANIGGNLEVTGEASVNGNTLATKVYVDAQVSAVVAGSAGSLDSLIDVDTTGVVSGNVLAYDGTNWVPSASTGGTSYTDADVASFLNGNLNGSIIPATNVTYDLGSATNKFRHLYLSDSTIYMGLAENTLRTSGTSILFNGADLQDYTLLKNKPEIPTDVNQLSDVSGLLGGGGGGGATTISALTDVDTTGAVVNSTLRYNGNTWVDTPPGHNSGIDADKLDGYHAYQFMGPLSGTSTRAIIISTNVSNNQLQLNTTDTSTSARLLHADDYLYIQKGAAGQTTNASSGGIRLSGYLNADVTYAQIRKNGIWNNIVTDGDINPSTVISTGDTANITLDPDPLTLGHIPVMINDLGFTRLRGGSLTSSNFSMSDAYFDAMFDPKGTFMYVDASSATDEASAMTFEFALAEGLLYDTKVGVSFSNGFGVSGIKVEAYRTSDSTWVEVINRSSNTDNYVTGSYNSLGGSGVTSFRVKLWSPTHVSGDVRMLHFNAIDFDSPLATTMFVDRTGGTVYGTITQTSDVNIKENISTLEGSLEKVNAMRGVSFTNKITKEDSIGVIAQEVEAIIPELVKSDENGMKSVAYSNMVALLLEAVKELTAKVEAQQQEINNLKGGN